MGEESPEADQVVDLTKEDLSSSVEVVDLTDKELEENTAAPLSEEPLLEASDDPKEVEGADKRMENQKENDVQAQNTDEHAIAEVTVDKAEARKEDSNEV